MGITSTLSSIFLFLVSDFYPCYYSLKGYRSPNSIADVEYWHKYWIIRSFLLMLEFLIWDFLQKIPGILLIRICIYLILAVFGGAGLLYDKILRPFLNKNEQRIDDGIEYLKAKFSYAFSAVTAYLTSFIKKQISDFVVGSLIAKKEEEKKSE